MIKLETRLKAILTFFDTQTRSKFKNFLNSNSMPIYALESNLHYTFELTLKLWPSFKKDKPK